MRMLMLGAATLALAAGSAMADPGKGKNGGGGGGNGGHGHAAAAPVPGGGGGGAGHGNAGAGNGKPKADRGNPGAQRAERASQPDRGPGRKAEQRTAVREVHGNGNGNGIAQRAAVREVGRDVRDVRVDRRGGDDPRVVRTVVRFDDRGTRGVLDGCPPGLAKKNNGCLPPGQAAQRANYRPTYYRPSWFGYPSAGDGRYYYDDGYLYRTNTGGSVLGYIPLLGGALSVGNPWPSYYQPVNVPDYYVDYYNLGAPDSYRYADDVLYRVDPQNDAITSIAALLTGDQFAVGQPMPAGYDVYNVPYAYRDEYYDTPEYDYRYADGYVYQVDPTTQLIEAAIQLLT